MLLLETLVYDLRRWKVTNCIHMNVSEKGGAIGGLDPIQVMGQ